MIPAPSHGTLTSADALLPDADSYAALFACLSDPTRIRLLHLLAKATGPVTVGPLARALGIGQPTCSHHLRKLADAGIVALRRDGTSTVITIARGGSGRLPHPVDVVIGALTTPTRGTHRDIDPSDVRVCALGEADWESVLRIPRDADHTNATLAPLAVDRRELDARWLPGHRWVAEVDGVVVGWAALAPVSSRGCYRHVAESTVFVENRMRGRGIATALLEKQVTAADASTLRTLQTSVLAGNRTALRLLHRAGFRTVGVREAMARHGDDWLDVILLERVRRAES
ncbi:metalloregulator ArsR/SmtB family transcription factor [Rhodococcus sp. ABRD24]|uniref:helix-turn-helix domain-containing GNAT family N-acetyltransferase n=1 Tax=Rhodococcus sp. ABRD24 TaxID=2507582 RepID=UPI001F625E88|nr:metalloregulator ArsR/SmtB family transcription factor [Rhodococcus sp. ABRD24]